MSTKQLTMRIPEGIYKQFKIIAAHEGKTMIETFVGLIRDRMNKHDEQSDVCPLCRPGGNIPNAETIEALEESRSGIGLSEPMSGEEYIKKLDAEFRKK